MTLVDDADSVLVVIDVQRSFLDKLEPRNAEETVDRVRWLVELAVILEVPVVVTEERPGSNGSTVDAVVRVLPEGLERHPKPAFGLVSCPPILADLGRHGRRTAVLCGLETDVCVAQSAVGLQDAGWKVLVVEDAVASAGTAHAQGLRRMASAGVELIGLKGLCYEWLRTLARTEELDGFLSAAPPTGITL